MQEQYSHLIEKASRDSIQHFVVGAVILDKNLFLLLKRPANDFMGGIFELPSGKVEEGESLMVALRREIKEETNLDLESISKVLNSFDYVSGSGKKTRQFNFLVKVSSNSQIKLTEHDSFVWCHRSDLCRYNVTDSVKSILNNI